MSKLQAVLVVVLLSCSAVAWAQPEAVLKAEAERVATINKVAPATVAIFARGGGGGGTGVLISDDGFALTNFHVVQPTGATPVCGLPDGVLYDAVLVGWDKVGDVALIKLLPKVPGQKFPYVVLGDSDTVKEGEWSMAMGNPFLLATDFTPTVTFGLVSGVHRYQPPAGVILEYTDCIQIDTSINPGNSGGPLFNMKGELIGINGRGSFDKRGRVNSGVGYAISINQIKNFMGHLKAGLNADHASLGAVVKSETEGSGLGRMVVSTILEEADAFRRGLDSDDEVVMFAGRFITSPNHLKNVLGLYPRGWRMPLEFKRENKRKEVLVRLMGVQRKGDDDDDDKKPPQKMPKIPPRKPGDPEQPGPKTGTPPPQGPGAKLYEKKQGFANYFFNREEKNRLNAAFRKNGDFANAGNWTFSGDARFLKNRTESPYQIEIGDEKDGAGTIPFVKIKIESLAYRINPLDATKEEMRLPAQSGGMLPVLFLYHRMMTVGPNGFSQECHHGGVEPCYPPPLVPEDTKNIDWSKRRVDCEVINASFGPYFAKFFFTRNDARLLCIEMRQEENEDPCEVYFSDYRDVQQRQMPHKLQVFYRDNHYGTFTISNYQTLKN